MTSGRPPASAESQTAGIGELTPFELRPKAPLEAGATVADKYRIERILAFGGMGVVCEATHIELGTTVAIKFVRREHMGDERTVARFLTEARSAAQLKSQHTCHVVDCGRLESGSPYMVMEYLEGADLRTVLSQQGPLPIEEAALFALQTCESLAEAHSRHIVHRDIKPENLFLTQGPDGAALVKVLDFGISKQLNRSRASRALTEPTESIGSPYHMSPEQMIDPTQVDARTDIWSLGVVLYELLSGRLPFNGDSTPQVCANVMTSRPVSLRELRPEIPEELERVVLRCLEKDRERRFADVAELGRALKSFGGATSTVAAARVERILERAQGARSERGRASTASDPTTSSTDIDTDQLPAHIPGLPRRRSGLALTAVLVGLIGLGSYGYHRVTDAARPESSLSPALPLPLEPVSTTDAALSEAMHDDESVSEKPRPPPPRTDQPRARKPVVRSVRLPDPKVLVEPTASPPPSSLYPEIKPIPRMDPPPE